MYSLYLNLSQKQISHLELLQNSLARAVTGTHLQLLQKLPCSCSNWNSSSVTAKLPCSCSNWNSSSVTEKLLARAVTGTPKKEHITLVLKSMH